MNSRRKISGWSLVLVGILIVVFSNKIVFPGLERLLGIETIVGRESVDYLPDGGYVFTNPGAMIRWISAVAGTGVAIAFLGAFMLFRSHTTRVSRHVGAAK